MKTKKITTLLLLLIIIFSSPAQQIIIKTVTLSGKVIEKETNLALESATVSVLNTETKKFINAVFTDNDGTFSIAVPPGNYDITIEFLSFKTLNITKNIQENTNLGTLFITSEYETLNEVSIVLEKPTVEIKLDKIIYNVGQDKLIKGGTASDVLDNVPSVTVDADGTVSLRGDDNVRILIDGKPSGMAGINIADALRMLPADAIEKVEVITNPSARYEAQGGAGIINIVLKKGKIQGLNGTVTVTTGEPANHGIMGNINYKTKHINIFSNLGYNYRKSPGSIITNSEYFDTEGNTVGFANETGKNKRLKKGINSNLGVEWYITENTSWTNSFVYTNNNGNNPNLVTTNIFDQNQIFDYVRTRDNYETNKNKNIEFASNLIHKFNEKGHQLIVDGTISKNTNYSNIFITDIEERLNGNTFFEKNITDQKQDRKIIQTDYVLPIGEKGHFESGYRGDFLDLNTNFDANFKNDPDTDFINNTQKTNLLNYKEYVNALYVQYGYKMGKLSTLFGLRWEDSNIHINVFSPSQDSLNNKKYNNFFPSMFLSYEINDKSSASINYSRRVTRPQSRFINPFVSNSSDINRFQGNPNLNPSFTDAINLAYLIRWEKITSNSSIYHNTTKDAFQFVSRESGEFTDDGKAIVIVNPINLATNYRSGLDLTISYNPYRWWRITGNYNLFRNQTVGDYTYIDYLGNSIYQNFDYTAYSWFTRITSKITLPYKIEWQANGTYNAPQNNAQGRNKGILSANLAFSKDLLQDKATLTLNVNDVFNSRKRIIETNLPAVHSLSEMQWRVRQITLAFSYRFNKTKNDRGDKDKQQRRGDSEGGDDFMG